MKVKDVNVQYNRKSEQTNVITNVSWMNEFIITLK